MVTTVSDGFNELKQRTNITDNQASVVSTTQYQIRSVMNSSFNVLEDFLQGSYPRETMIAPLSEADIDIFIVLNPEYYQQNNQRQLLSRVQAVLRNRYSTTKDITPDGQAVTIEFQSMGFCVDVVPAFYANGGGFMIPDTQGLWIRTNPKVHQQISTRLNQANSGKLVPFIKMIKAWNSNIRKPFRGFHLEVLAWDIFGSGFQINDYQSALLNFFNIGASKITTQNADPAGYNQDVGNYIIGQEEVQFSRSCFVNAYQSALNAVRYESQGQTQLAINSWREIFGNYFPTYGY